MLSTLLALSLCATQPTLRLEGRGSNVGHSIVTTWSDSLGEVVRVTFKDPYWGVGLNAVYDPLGWCYARLELAEARFFDAGGGGLTLFPTAGLDALVEPPLKWRLLPYLWGGARWTGYWGSQDTPDPRFYGQPDYEARAGLGLRWLLDRHLQVYGETQVFLWTTFLMLRIAGTPRATGSRAGPVCFGVTSGSATTWERGSGDSRRACRR